MSVPSVAELIRDHGRKLNGRRCGLCERWSLFWVGSVAEGFSACLMCDTNVESRKAAKIPAP